MRGPWLRYLTPLAQSEVRALAKHLAALPPNELGFTICQGANGLTRGPVAHGTPTSVNVRVQCPVGSQMLGIYHTHPGGTSRPSSTDVHSAVSMGAKVLCVQSDRDGLQCYRMKVK